MKVQISEDELYPHYFCEFGNEWEDSDAGNRAIVEVDDETALRWQEARKAFMAVRAEIAAVYHKYWDDLEALQEAYCPKRPAFAKRRAAKGKL